MAAAMIDFGARGAEAAAKVFISAMVHPVGTGGVHAEFEKGTEGTEGAEDAEDVDGLDGAEGEVQMYAAAPAAPAAMATFDWLKAVCDAEGALKICSCTGLSIMELWEHGMAALHAFSALRTATVMIAGRMIAASL